MISQEAKAKLRQVVEREVRAGFFFELEKALRQNSKYVKALVQFPKFMESRLQLLVDAQMPFYEHLSDDVAHAAGDFFNSPQGQEYVRATTQFQLQSGVVAREHAIQIVRELDSLSIN